LAFPSLTVEDLTVFLGNTPITQGLSLTLQDGEFVAIIGVSGCGKTTFLRTIAGLIPPSSGTIMLYGEPITGPEARVSMVFQHFGLFPWKTVEKNVSDGIDVQNRRDDDGRVDRLLATMHLEGSRKKYPYQLSGGMKQRAGIARALCMEPQLLLLDEPLSAVDAITREELQGEVLNLWERQSHMNALLVTHDLDEAIMMADRVVVFAGPPAHIILDVRVPIERPRDPRSIRAHPEYAQLRAKLWSTLQEANQASTGAILTQSQETGGVPTQPQSTAPASSSRSRGAS
jgi:ABC-type nitrate/sulfonate/bicarbonate transport system ATPase subunit